MPYVLIHHQVKDFDTWKRGYDNHLSVRNEAGLTELQRWRNADNPDDILVLFEARDLELARKFSSSDSLKKAMETAGVTGTPQIVFLNKG